MADDTCCAWTPSDEEGDLWDTECGKPFSKNFQKKGLTYLDTPVILVVMGGNTAPKPHRRQTNGY
jgi:hypothetical protein